MKRIVQFLTNLPGGVYLVILGAAVYLLCWYRPGCAVLSWWYGQTQRLRTLTQTDGMLLLTLVHPHSFLQGRFRDTYFGDLVQHQFQATHDPVVVVGIIQGKSLRLARQFLSQHDAAWIPVCW